MKKIILYFTTIAIILLFTVCSNEEILIENKKEPVAETKPETKPDTVRTISFTAYTPPDDPATRTTLTQDQNTKNIKVRWEEGDIINLVFVQSGWDEVTGQWQVLEKGTATVESISEGGKKAEFTVVLPLSSTGFNSEVEFDLHGFYGGGGIEIIVQPGLEGESGQKVCFVILPTDPSSATSLNNEGSASVQNREDMMLGFFSGGISACDLQTVTFNHLGSLFNITVKNTTPADSPSTLSGLTQARLVGVGNGGWAINSGAGGIGYNFMSGYISTWEAQNYISFATPTSTLTQETPITFWGWYPILNNDEWPELKLELIANNTLVSMNTRPAKTPIAGKSYSFYATWNGSQLSFSDKNFNPQSGPTVFNVITAGDLETLVTDKNITAMKVTGPLNSADFTVMKTQMPNLKYLDLSGVTNTTIPSNAFGTDSYTSEANKTIRTLILPLNITKIESYAFRGCDRLTGSLDLPTTLLTIGNNAFEECSGLSGTLTIPDNVTSIGSNAFEECSSLAGLLLGNNIATIGANAFYNCEGFMGTLILPATLKSIGTWAFADCSGFTGNLIFPTELESIGAHAFQSCHSFTGDLTIPDNITTIGESTFINCAGFNGTLSLSTNLTSIEAHAFSSCDGFIGNLIIPSGMTTIGEGAFSGCSGFTGSLNLSTTALISMGKYAFSSCSGFTGTLSLPSGLTKIEESAFNRCDGFSGILTIPSGVTTIENNAFYECIGFTSISTPLSNLEMIKERAFYGCTGFTGNLTIPDKVTWIKESAFYGCIGLSGTVFLPESLTTIDEFGFKGCDNVSIFRFQRSNPIPYYVKPNPYNTYVFLPTDAKIEVPAAALGAYQVAPGWMDHTPAIRGYTAL